MEVPLEVNVSHESSSAVAIIRTWNSNNDNSHSNNQNIHKLFAFLSRAHIGMIWQISNKSEQENKE